MRTKQSKHNTESEKEEQHGSHQTTAVKLGARKTVKLLLYMFTLQILQAHFRIRIGSILTYYK